MRCVIDCIEFNYEAPMDHARQRNVCPSYKYHTTFKVLIAFTPNGRVCLIYDLYDCDIDDVTITAKCGILDHIEPWISCRLIRILQFKIFCMKNRQQLEYQHFWQQTQFDKGRGNGNQAHCKSTYTYRKIQ